MHTSVGKENRLPKTRSLYLQRRFAWENRGPVFQNSREENPNLQELAGRYRASQPRPNGADTPDAPGPLVQSNLLRLMQEPRSKPIPSRIQCASGSPEAVADHLIALKAAVVGLGVADLLVPLHLDQ